MTSVLRWEDPGATPRVSRWEGFRAGADDLRAAKDRWGVLFEGSATPAVSLSTAIKNGSDPFAPKGAFESATRTVTVMVGERMTKVVRTYARYVGTADGDPR